MSGIWIDKKRMIRHSFLVKEELELMVYRKTKATEERKEARRRLILDSATRLFGKHGYHATTVPMIVAEAESSTGSFYMYFRNKEDVFAVSGKGV